jgi:hypothetical protein
MVCKKRRAAVCSWVTVICSSSRYACVFPLSPRKRVPRTLLPMFVCCLAEGGFCPSHPNLRPPWPRSEALDPFVQLHAKAVQRHGHQGVLAHRKHRVHQLFGAVLRTQGGPGRIADDGLRMQLVGCP